MSLKKMPCLEKSLTLLFLIVSIIGVLVTIRKDLRELPQQPRIIVQPAKPLPPSEDIKTGSISKKIVVKPKPTGESPATLLDWLKWQFEPDPLRDKYTRD